MLYTGCIRSAGVGIPQVARLCDSASVAGLEGRLRVSTSAILHAPNPFPDQCAIYQIKGPASDLSNGRLSFIPIAGTRRVAIAAGIGDSGEQQEVVGDHTAVEVAGSQARAHARLESIVEGVIDPSCGLRHFSVTFCERALFEPPDGHTATSGEGRLRGIAVFKSVSLGGRVSNLVHASPGKLGNFVSFADTVRRHVQDITGAA